MAISGLGVESNSRHPHRRVAPQARGGTELAAPYRHRSEARLPARPVKPSPMGQSFASLQLFELKRRGVLGRPGFGFREREEQLAVLCIAGDAGQRYASRPVGRVADEAPGDRNLTGKSLRARIVEGMLAARESPALDGPLETGQAQRGDLGRVAILEANRAPVTGSA